MPRVSVVIPTRDRRGKLAMALASVDAQTFRDFEIVVIDDGSSDGTAAWIRENRPGVCLIENPQSQGAAAARNRGVERARGEIIAFLDDDDVWRPSFLKVQVALFDALPDADLCSTGHVEVHAGGGAAWPDLRPMYSYPDSAIHFLAECPIHTLSVVACRRTAFDRTGMFDEELSIVHDLDWYVRLALAGGIIVHVSAAMVERSIPGGLVARHREWCQEERLVHLRVFARNEYAERIQSRVWASRALFFARLGFVKGDLTFGLSRLAEAMLHSPLDFVSIVVRRLLRRGQTRIPQESAWENP